MARVPVEQRRSDLVEAAIRVISANGIAQLTTRAICAEAGVHQSVFHYSFRSKKELFEELVRITIVDMVDAAVLTSVVDSEPEASIHRGFQRLWERVQEHRDRHLASYELTTYALRDPELADLAAWQYQQYFTEGQRFIRAVEEASGVTWSLPPDVLSRLFTTAIDGLVLAWLTDGETDVTTASLEALADFLISVMVVPTGDAAQALATSAVTP